MLPSITSEQVAEVTRARGERARIALIVITGIIIAAALWQWRFSFPFDDAYITFRYAQNVANGHGIVWNIGGPHTEGYTNFLLVIFLAPSVWFNADLLIISQLIGIVSTILTALVLFRLVKLSSQSDVWPLLSAILYLFLPFTWANALSGLETSLFVLAITAAFYFAAKRGWKLCFILLSLVCLARPDGALGGLILFASTLLVRDRSERRASIQAMLIYFFCPMLLYAAFKLFYFGDLLPNSFYIKTGSGLHGVQSVKDFVRGNLILLLISLYAAWRYFRTLKMFLPLLLWSVALVLFYLWPEPLQGFYYRFEWTAIPLVAILTAFALARVRPFWLSLTLVVLVVVGQVMMDLRPLRRDMALATNERGRTIYQELGTALRSLPHHERLTFAFQDAGAVPYYSEMRNIDLVGLNTTAIAHSKRAVEVCNYLESAHPNIILLPAYNNKTTCWSLFTSGHGKTGELMPLIVQGRVIQGYLCAGRITYLGYDILCYVIPEEAAAINTEFSKYPWYVPGSIPCLQ